MSVLAVEEAVEAGEDVEMTISVEVEVLLTWDLAVEEEDVVVDLEAEALVLVLEVETLAEASAEEAVAAEKIVIACSSVASHGKAPKMMLDRTFKMFSQMPQISVYHQTEKIQTK